MNEASLSKRWTLSAPPVGVIAALVLAQLASMLLEVISFDRSGSPSSNILHVLAVALGALVLVGWPSTLVRRRAAPSSQKEV